MMRKVSTRNPRAPRGGVGAPSDRAPTADGGEAMSSARARMPDMVPAGWIDRLLVVALDLPIFEGERALVDAMVEAIAGILPAYAVGACLVGPSGSGEASQVLMRRLPAGSVDAPTGVDPTRIFAGFTHEYVVPIPGRAAGSTLHLASNTDPLDRDTSAAAHLTERASMVLGRAVENARAIASVGAGRVDARDVEQRLLQADKLASFGQIAAGVVHELNNPLTSIVAYSDYLARKATSGGQALEADDIERLRRIGESATRMLRFTRDLVSYARPSEGVSSPVAVHAVIDRAIAFCDHVLSEAGMSVERRYGADVPTVRAVGEQLVQVFVNLLTNASQAAPARDGRVVVTTGQTDRDDGTKRVVITVEDNGSGIAAEHMPRVFLPFFTTKQHKDGTGLGLSIVRSVLQSHDGSIRVESEPGRSTRFIIDLPGVTPTEGP
jgi:two-component system, NtrC family, sensor kinase